MREKSNTLFRRARTIIPGGVNSPVRAGKAVGMDPPFITRAKGCRIWDADDNEYVDYVGSWGPMILGHAHPEILDALRTRLESGTSFGAPTELELELAETIVEMVPSIEMVRMVNSGTEATMSAIRLARAVTGRDKLVKFDGCYHGHADSLLVSAGSGVATLGIPGSPGVPADLAKKTLSLPYNDPNAVRDAFERYGQDIAALIVEPVAGNMGVVGPEPGFLEGLREATAEYGSLLIFDEVMTGFRVAPGGAQERFGIMPDLTCLGKVIGGGMPVGAYGGKRTIMERVAPEGDVYQAGTLSGNPLAMAAGLTTLRILKEGSLYEELERLSSILFNGLKNAARDAGVEIAVNRIGSMGSIFFTAEPVKDFVTAKASDQERFKKYYPAMLEMGIYLAPSPFESLFVSSAHDREVIDRTVEYARKALESL